MSAASASLNPTHTCFSFQLSGYKEDDWFRFGTNQTEMQRSASYLVLKGIKRKHIMLPFIHSFIHSICFRLLLPCRVPRGLRVWAGVHPGQVLRSSQGNTKTNILSQPELSQSSRRAPAPHACLQEEGEKVQPPEPGRGPTSGPAGHYHASRWHQNQSRNRFL